MEKYGIAFLQGYGLSNCEGIVNLHDVKIATQKGDYQHSAYRIAIIGTYQEASQALDKCYEEGSLDFLYNYSIVFPTAI